MRSERPGLIALTCAFACSTAQPPAPAGEHVAEAPPAAPTDAQSRPPGPPSATAVPTGAASGATGAAMAPPATSASAAASAEPPPPNVRVENIGMHVGGGPNDAETKSPIRQSVEPHFDELRRCFASAEDPKQGDYSIDLRIDKDGGKARVSHPRTSIHGDAFKQCVIGVFEKIDFLRPRHGTTVVSYSLRFSPR